MTSDVYKKALGKANQDFMDAIRKRDYWTMEVARLQNVIKSLTAMTEKGILRIDVPEETPEVGLQEIVFTCVRNACPEPISPMDVRDMIRMGGLADLSRYANPLAVIHGALKRLVTQRKIREGYEGTYRMPAAFEGLVKSRSKK